MSTVDKTMADRIVAGEFPESQVTHIIEYEHRWGGKGYGVVLNGQDPAKYSSSPYVTNPRVYWEAK